MNSDNGIDLESVIGSVKKDFQDGFREGQEILGKHEEPEDKPKGEGVKASVSDSQDDFKEKLNNTPVNEESDPEEAPVNKATNNSARIDPLAFNTQMALGVFALIAIGVYMVDEDIGSTALTILVLLAIVYAGIRCVLDLFKK